MWGIGILLLAGSLFQVIFTGVNALGIIMLVTAILFLLTTLPNKKASEDKPGSKKPIASLLPLIFLIIFLLEGALFNPFKQDGKTASEYDRAITQYNQGKYEKALEALQKLNTEKPNDAQINMAMGMTYMQMDNQDQAWNHLNAAINLNPYDINIMFNRALNRYKAGRKEESLGMFESLAYYSPALFKARLYSGTISMELHDYPRAIYHLNIAAQATSREVPAVFYYLGQCHTALMEYIEAEEAFSHALELKPSKELTSLIENELLEIKSYLGGEIK